MNHPAYKFGVDLRDLEISDDDLASIRAIAEQADKLIRSVVVRAAGDRLKNPDNLNTEICLEHTYVPVSDWASYLQPLGLPADIIGKTLALKVWKDGQEPHELKACVVSGYIRRAYGIFLSVQLEEDPFNTKIDQVRWGFYPDGTKITAYEGIKPGMNTLRDRDWDAEVTLADPQ